MRSRPQPRSCALDGGLQLLQPVEFGHQQVRLVAEFGNDGAHQHGAAERGQNVIGFDDEGGGRILFQPLQAGEEFGQHVLLLAEVRQQPSALLGKPRQFRLALGNDAFLRLDRLGDRRELLRHTVLFLDCGSDLGGDAGFRRLGTLELLFERFELLLVLSHGGQRDDAQACPCGNAPSCGASSVGHRLPHSVSRVSELRPARPLTLAAC